MELIFKVYEKDCGNRNREVEATSNVLVEKFFASKFMIKFVYSRKNYIDLRKYDQSDLYYWKDSNVSSTII